MDQKRDRQGIERVNGAMGWLPPPSEGIPGVVVIGTEAIRRGFDPVCLQQAQRVAAAPGVTDVVLNPDAHAGYGAPIGCVLASPTHIYPGPVGVDMKCSMSLLQLDLPGEALRDQQVRRELIHAIAERTPTGAGKGQRSVRKGRPVGVRLGFKAVTQGITAEVCRSLGVPLEWAARCEDASHTGHDGTRQALERRLDDLLETGRFPEYDGKIEQLGSYGGGNHFGEASVVEVVSDDEARRTARHFGLVDGGIAFMSHCGSRGFGYHLATNQFKTLQHWFAREDLPLPGGEKQLVYAPLGTPQADDYLDDLGLAGNFATVNHLLINALVLEAFQEVMPGVRGRFVYLISHNTARWEYLNGRSCWVHRKGATRAFPAGHPGLAGTVFERTGHPILLPGNPQSGSVVMVARAGADRSCYSINHGAGRTMSRRNAKRTLKQDQVDQSFREADILTNTARYPLDEAPAAYKDFGEVVRSVELAGLARRVAHLRTRLVIKDQGR